MPAPHTASAEALADEDEDEDTAEEEAANFAEPSLP